MSSLMRLFINLSCHTSFLSPCVYVYFCMFGDRCLIACFNIDYSIASAITFPTVKAAYSYSTYVSFSTLVSINECNVGNLRV